MNPNFNQIKKAMWEIIIAENIIVTNQNLDWLIERAFKKVQLQIKERQHNVDKGN